MSDAALTTTLSPPAAEAVLEYFNAIVTSRAVNFQLRHRMLEVDKRAMREQITGEKKLELTVPIITPQISSMVAYLSRIFLGTPEVFPMAATPGGEAVSEQYNALLTQFASNWQWRRNLMLAFQDGAKYNLMALEATWQERSVGQLSNNLLPGGKGVETKKVVAAGFSLRRLDLYNTFWDMSVEPAKVAEDGDFVGYYELMTSIRLRRFLGSLPDNSNFNHKLTAIVDGVPTARHYYIPQVNTSVTSSKYAGGMNWDTFLSSGTSVTQLHAGMHEVTTLYARIVPKDLQITKQIPAPGTPQIWKFILVDGMHIVYAERRTNAHDRLPIVFGQPREDGLSYQSKSLAEELFDIQHLSSTLWSMEVESTRRILADRGLFNPQMIASADINNPGATAKIPVRNTAYGQPLSSAYYQIPYNDPGLGTRSGVAQQLTQFANAVSGQNQVDQGGFVKGNKTNDQFAATMAGSDARQVMMAVLLEDQFFNPIKALLKSDLLQYQQPVKVLDKTTGQMVEVNPAALRTSDTDFVVTDGLMNIDKVMSTEMLTSAMQNISSNPRLAAEYKLAPLFNYLMKLKGVKGLDKFMKTEQEKQAAAQQQAQQAGQEAGAVATAEQSGAPDASPPA